MPDDDFSRAPFSDMPALRLLPADQGYSRRAVASLVIAAAPLVTLGAAFFVRPLQRVFAHLPDPTLFAAVMVCAVVGVVVGVGTLRGLRRVHVAHRPRGRWMAVTAVVVGGAMTLFGALLTWISTADFARGRQLRRRGRVQLPPVVAGDAHLAPASPVDVDGALRPALAAAWRHNGATEHASVASFARLSLDLLALGAPPALVRATHDDALDEMRHTTLCFLLARDLDGAALGPGPFPAATSARALSGPRTLALARLAVDSLVDGAVHEAVSARVVARLVRRTTERRARAVLRAIAADEGRHAAHGWDVVTWCLAVGQAPVAAALRGAVRALPLTMQTVRPPEARRGAWEAYGIHGDELEREVYAAVRADVAARVLALVDTREQVAAVG